MRVLCFRFRNGPEPAEPRRRERAERLWAGVPWGPRRHMKVHSGHDCTTSPRNYRLQGAIYGLRAVSLFLKSLRWAPGRTEAAAPLTERSPRAQRRERWHRRSPDSRSVLPGPEDVGDPSGSYPSFSPAAWGEQELVERWQRPWERLGLQPRGEL